jgi:putative phage-type endonuclease
MATSVTSGLTNEQLEARKLGIGGSDAASVLGCNPYRSARELYELKLGLREPDAPNAQMKRGIYLEAVARRLYTELTGRKTRRIKQQVHPSYPFMLCNVDGQIVGDKRGPGVLELKCPAIWTFAKVKREGLPLHYIVQMQHNLTVTGCKWGSFALFNADAWELIHFDVARDIDLIDALIVKEEQFWRQHIEQRVPPPEVSNTTPELVAQLAKAEAAGGGGELILRNDEEWNEAARMTLEARELLETAENLKASAQEKLKLLMGKVSAVEGGGIRCYWSERDGRRSFDRKALEATAPLDRIAVATAINQRVMHDGTKDALLAELVNCGVDLTKFEKVGQPYDDFRVYQLRSVGVGD